MSVRAASFVSAERGPDTVRLVVEQSADLLALRAPLALVESGKSPGELDTVLSRCPCDVAIVVGSFQQRWFERWWFERPADTRSVRRCTVRLGSGRARRVAGAKA